jgi:hypothetical protein
MLKVMLKVMIREMMVRPTMSIIEMPVKLCGCVV